MVYGILSINAILPIVLILLFAEVIHNFTEPPEINLGKIIFWHLKLAFDKINNKEGNIHEN